MTGTVRKAAIGKAAAKAASKAAAKAPAKARPASPVVAAKTTPKTIQATPTKSKAAATPNKGAAEEMKAKAPISAQTQPISGPAEILGQIAWLMMSSPAHKHLFLADLEWLAAPAVLMKQFRIYNKQNVPLAYASWAFLSEEAERRLTSGVRRIPPSDWNSGERAWLIDLVAPFGGAEEFLADLKEKVFSDKPLMTLRPNPGGAGFVVAEVKARERKAEGVR